MSSFDPRYRETNVAANLTDTLHRIGQAITSLLREKGRPYGLSPTQMEALMFLTYSRHGVRTIGGLAQRLGCTPATASGVADVLERKGLAVRQRWFQHRRTVTLTLTRDGAALAARVEGSLNELEAIAGELAPEAQHSALQSAHYILRGLADHGQIILYEMCRKCAHFQPNAHPDELAGPHRCDFIDLVLAEAETYTECPDFVAMQGKAYKQP